MTDALKRLSDEGVAIWLDDLSRKRITSGNLAELIDSSHVVGVTTNPSIFQKAISEGDGYDQQLADLAVRKVTVEEALRMITTADGKGAGFALFPNRRRPRMKRISLALAAYSCHQAVSVRAGTRHTIVAPFKADSYAFRIQSPIWRP